jgi:hypothetical protein
MARPYYHDDDDMDAGYRLASNWIAGGLPDDDDDLDFAPEDRYTIDLDEFEEGNE